MTNRTPNGASQRQPNGSTTAGPTKNQLTFLFTKAVFPTLAQAFPLTWSVAIADAAACNALSHKGSLFALYTLVIRFLFKKTGSVFFQTGKSLLQICMLKKTKLPRIGIKIFGSSSSTS